MMIEQKPYEETETPEEGVRTEEFVLSGDKVISKIKELVRESSVRRISLKNAEGTTLIEIPMTVGVAGAVAGVLLAPVWAAIGAIAAMVAQLKIVVERIEDEDED